MNNCGALLSNKIDEENEDEYEKEDARKNAVLEFKNINLSGHSMLKDWIIQLPQKENPICLAMGVEWCCVYTSNFFLRIFSLYGNQRMILSLPQVICMAGYENHLAYVYHSSLPLFNNQSLRIKILNSNAYFNEIYDGVLPLSPEASLTWFGYSEDGVLLTLDSRKILRGFFLRL
jgi:chromosome transmission fidelity protein 4